MEETIVSTFVQKEILRNTNGYKPGITDNLIERGIIDSLGIVKLISHLEKTFKIQIADDELLPVNFETIQSIAAFVRSKQNKKDRAEKKDLFCMHQGV